MESKKNTNNEWNVDTLDKAYRQGFMHGLAGESRHAPYRVEIVTAAWEAGYDDGYEHYRESLEREETNSDNHSVEEQEDQIA